MQSNKEDLYKYLSFIILTHNLFGLVSMVHPSLAMKLRFHSFNFLIPSPPNSMDLVKSSQEVLERY